MPTDFFFDLGLELLEVGEHFALLLHRKDPCVVGVVVDEGDVVPTSSDGWYLSWSPYIRVDHVEEAFAYMDLLWKGKSVLFVELTSFMYSVDLF